MADDIRVATGDADHLAGARAVFERDPEEYWRRVQWAEGRQFMDRRFVKGGFVWGMEPAPSAVEAESLGRQASSRGPSLSPLTVLVPCCAYGRNAFHFGRSGWRVRAFDTSEVAIGMARELARAQPAFQNSVRFHVADATTAYADELGELGMYDLVYLGKALHQFRAGIRERVIAFLRDLIRAGGLLVISAMARSGTVYEENAGGIEVEQGTNDSRGFRPAHYYELCELRDLLSTSGFVDVQVKTIAEPETHARGVLETSGDQHVHDMLFAGGRRDA